MPKNVNPNGKENDPLFVIYQELADALKNMRLDCTKPAIVHTSLSSFGHVEGGAQAILGALLENFNTIIAPAFTYKSMVTPEVGPPENAVEYGSWSGANRMAEFFAPDLPVDKTIGILPETLRTYSQARRTSHPIMSFVGINAEDLLDAQTPNDPLGPIAALVEQDGWVALLGVTHIINTAIHLGEQLAGRRTFTRWALTPKGIVACPGYPACSEGFDAIDLHLIPYIIQAQVGQALVQVIPVRDVVNTARKLVEHNPLALLCAKDYCERCNAVRQSVGLVEA